MSKYVKNVAVECSHGGDTIKIVARPLKFSDLLVLEGKLKPSTAEPGKLQDDGSMLVAFMEMLPRYIVSIEGATDADGAPITADDLATAYWGKVTAEVMSALVEASGVQNPT